MDPAASQNPSRQTAFAKLKHVKSWMGSPFRRSLEGKPWWKKILVLTVWFRKLFYRLQYPGHIGICGTAGAGHALMIIRSGQQMVYGKELVLKKDWVSGSAISSHFKLAVICAEDQNFLDHNGFDLGAIKKALDHNKRSRRKRGASTISQQTAKNVFLWPGRSWVRKGLEVWFTGLIELLWSKKRIMTVYLNIVELGPGVYGAEAAAQQYFKKPANKLGPSEAALLAAVLPSPLRYSVKKPGPFVQRRQQWVMRQMRMFGGISYLNTQPNW
jgi:monofunctional biosynthetic peptidoglycan transglycosylase